MRSIRIGLSALLCAAAVAGAAEEQPYKNCRDYIQRTGKLWGVCEVATNADGTVTLVDAKNAGYGYGLAMYDSEEQVVPQVTLKPKQHCRLADGDHACLKYEIRAVKDGVVEVIVTERFDARSFGKNVTEQTETVSVKPYKDEDQKPAAGH